MFWPLLWVVLLVLASALFVAAEFALIAARRSLIEPQALASRRARMTLSAMDEVSVMMACAQLGITVCGLLLGAIGEPAVASLISPPLASLGVPAAAVEPVALVVALFLVVALHVTFGEMVPKNAALAGPEQAALALAPTLRVLTTVLGPLVRGLDHLANGVVRALGVVPATEVASTFTRQELAELVTQSARAGLLDPEDEQLVGSALTFDTAIVADVMVPDDNVVVVGPQPTPAEVEDACAQFGFSRFPVLAETDQGRDFAGFAHIRDVLTVPPSGRNQPLPTRLIHELPVFPKTAGLRTVLETMRATQTHIGRVIGPGESRGVVLLEDVIEVLVGDIADATQSSSGESLG